MSMRCLFVLVPCLLATRAAGAEDRPVPGACDLITRAEIEAVQGEPVLDAKGSARHGAGFAVTQCYYSLPSSLKSISLEVTRPAPERIETASPRERWKAMFHGGATREEGAREAGQEAGEPLAVSGLGDEAFWAGNGLVDALYVLQEDSYLRISIGGAEDASLKMQKTRALAQDALRRLR
jgi:hypothetical protein